MLNSPEGNRFVIPLIPWKHSNTVFPALILNEWCHHAVGVYSQLACHNLWNAPRLLNFSCMFPGFYLLSFQSLFLARTSATCLTHLTSNFGNAREWRVKGKQCRSLLARLMPQTIWTSWWRKEAAIESVELVPSVACAWSNCVINNVRSSKRASLVHHVRSWMLSVPKCHW